MKKRKWFGFFGFLGFVGLYYFVNHDIVFLSFFMFFSFFSFFGLAKFEGILEDECFLANKMKASYISQKVGYSTAFIAFFTINSVLFQENTELKYTVFVAILSLIYSVSVMLYMLLLRKFESEK